jgi:hypothetical protein
LERQERRRGKGKERNKERTKKRERREIKVMDLCLIFSCNFRRGIGRYVPESLMFV